MPRFQHRDTGVEVMARQVKPGNWPTTVSWCSGWPTLVDGNQGCLVVNGDLIIGHASLGDWVIQDADETFRPMDAGLFGQAYDEV